ncbi:MAG: cupin domain-containing protein [Candidatus Lokiarchaeota archaeon]|nr:cupin domain-containing protein [Candidatus Lokiarchaeota archaeon]
MSPKKKRKAKEGSKKTKKEVKGLDIVNLKDAPALDVGIKGLTLKILCGKGAPTATENLVVGYLFLEPGAVIESHHHDYEEFQYVLSGTGILEDTKGNKTELRPEMGFYCPSGPEGVHKITNTGDYQLNILFIHSTEKGGKMPQLTWSDD